MGFQADWRQLGGVGRINFGEGFSEALKGSDRFPDLAAEAI